MTAALKKAGAERKSPAKKKAATESADSVAKTVNLFEGLPTGTKVDGLPTPEEAEVTTIPSPYPDGVKTWTYQPKDEKAAPIVLPTTDFQPSNKLWHFDLAQLPMLAQTWKWMDRANVPKNIQRQAQLLDDTEYFSMFNEWFNVMLKARAPKDAVTAGK